MICPIALRTLWNGFRVGVEERRTVREVTYWNNNRWVGVLNFMIIVIFVPFGIG